VPTHGFCDIKEKLIPQLYAAGERIVVYEAAQATPRVIDVSTYMAVNEWVVEHLVRTGEEPDLIREIVRCCRAPDAFIADDATIIGPVLVGPGARILSRAVVIGPTSRDAKQRSNAADCGHVLPSGGVRVGEQANAERCASRTMRSSRLGRRLVGGS
jgi:NDP-sugar pyrophosphorylase family protein